jgi:hypothetical protein
MWESKPKKMSETYEREPKKPQNAQEMKQIISGMLGLSIAEVDAMLEK